MAVLLNEEGEEVKVSMVQRWPVKVAVKAYKEKPRPEKIMKTGVRIIDSFNPIAEGGTGFIPDRSAAEKPYSSMPLQSKGSRYIVMAACGERANEVVEIFTEFPELIDPIPAAS